MTFRPSLILSVNEAENADTSRLSARLQSVADVMQSNGGIHNLMNFLRHMQREPDIVFIELNGEPTQIFAELNSLQDHISSDTAVFGFGQINDARFLRSLLSVGFQDYFILPFDDDQLDDITRLIAARETASQQPVIGLVSLAGGVGTSLVALNYADFLAGHSVTGVALTHPQPPPYNTQFDRLDFDTSGTSNSTQPILIKAGHTQIDEDDHFVGGEARQNELDAYRAKGTIILIDIGTHLSDHSILARCDHFIVVGEPDYRSLINIKPLNGFLASQFPFAERHFALTKIGHDGRIEFAENDLRALIDELPIMLYRYDPDAIASSLAKPVPLLPMSLLQDQSAFEKLSTRCRIALKPGSDHGVAESGILGNLRALLTKRKTANG